MRMYARIGKMRGEATTGIMIIYSIEIGRVDALVDDGDYDFNFKKRHERADVLVCT